LQGYLDTAQLYEDNWVTIVPDTDGIGWQLLKDVLKPAAQEYAPGTRVQGLYSDGTWYSGTVQGKNPQGVYLVSFDGYEGSPPEPCNDVKLEGSTITTTAAPVAPVAPVVPVAPVAPVAPAPSPKVWHVLASDGVNTNGPFSVDELSEQLRDGIVLSTTVMIHETGAEWVTVGSAATAAPSSGGGGGGGGGIVGEGQSAREYVASQTRRKHSRNISKVTVFAPPVAETKPRAPSQTGSRSAPVKSGTKKYRSNENAYDEEGAMVICQWMELILRRDIATDAKAFMEVLQTDTHIFAELFNEFKPNSTRKVKKSKMRFKQYVDSYLLLRCVYFMPYATLTQHTTNVIFLHCLF
jgi:hypothetical protein